MPGEEAPKEYATDEVVVLRQTVKLQGSQIEELKTGVSAQRVKKLKDKVSEHKGNLCTMVSEYRIQKLRADRLQRQVAKFRSVFYLLPPFPGEAACRVHVDEKKLFSYFKEFGNPEMLQTEKEPIE